jgi:hypothetical protein
MQCNLSRADRIVRALLGVVLVACGVSLAVFGGGWPLGLLGVGLALVGGILVFSAWRGFCHVYKVLHLSTLKRP